MYSSFRFSKSSGDLAPRASCMHGADRSAAGPMPTRCGACADFIEITHNLQHRLAALRARVRRVFSHPPLPCFPVFGAAFLRISSRHPWRLDYRVSGASGDVYCPCSGSAWLELRIWLCRTLVSLIVDFLPDRHYFCPDSYMLRDFSSPYPFGPTIRVSRLSGAVY